jgi:hypothetical protein
VGRAWRWFLDHQPEIHLALTIIWILLIVPSLLWWRDSVLWVILLSLWANIASHFAGWSAARAERKVDASNGD